MSEECRFAALSTFRWGTDRHEHTRVIPLKDAIGELSIELREKPGRTPQELRVKIVKRLLRAIPRMLSGELVAIEVLSTRCNFIQMHGLYRDLENSSNGATLLIQIDTGGGVQFEEHQPGEFSKERIERMWHKAVDAAFHAGETDAY